MIEKLAVNYKPATPEKSCARCYQSEWLEESLFCHQFDCDTRQDMVCGLFIRMNSKTDQAIRDLHKHGLGDIAIEIDIESVEVMDAVRRMNEKLAEVLK